MKMPRQHPQKRPWPPPHLISRKQRCWKPSPPPSQPSESQGLLQPPPPSQSTSRESLAQRAVPKPSSSKQPQTKPTVGYQGTPQAQRTVEDIMGVYSGLKVTNSGPTGTPLRKQAIQHPTKRTFTKQPTYLNPMQNTKGSLVTKDASGSRRSLCRRNGCSRRTCVPRVTNSMRH